MPRRGGVHDDVVEAALGKLVDALHRHQLLHAAQRIGDDTL